MLPMIAGYVMGQKAAARAGAMSASQAAMGAGPQAAVEVLDERFDRMLLVMEAMWTLLKEKGMTDEQLGARLHELDSADGMVDGRRVRSTLTCRSCQSKIPAGMARCQICGAETGVVPGPLDNI